MTGPSPTPSKTSQELGVPMAQVALAWEHRNPAVTAPMVGAAKTSHLTDAAGALDIRLTNEQAHTLEKAYTARMPTGY